jgi:hypothetical protein
MLPVTSLKDLNEEIIQEFYSKHSVESTRFDYKRELGDLRNERNKMSFLRDITSFANTQGGDLIVGVDEGQGLVGIYETDVNSKILQIESIIRDNTDPPVPGIQIQFVPIGNEKYILVIRTPKSYIRPHRLSKDGHDFFARGEAGNYPIKMPQLRNLFLVGEEVRKDIRQFISERVGSILTNDSFFELDLSKGVFILHVIPLQSFENDILLSASKMRENKEMLVPIAHRSGGLEEVNNFEGLNRYDKDGLKVENYAQIFNSGMIECVNTWMLSVESQWGPYLHADSFAKGLFSGLHSLIKYLEALGLSFPIILHLELHGIKNIQLSTSFDNVNMFMSQKRLRNDSLRFPSIVLTNQPESTKPNYFVREIKIWMDLLWRAFGYPECKSYNDKGYKFSKAQDGFMAFDKSENGDIRSRSY